MVLTILLFLATCVHAVDWKMEHLNAGDPIREGAPIPLRIRVHNPTGRPVEGVIESSVQSGGTVVVTHRTPAMVIASDLQVLSLLLPPVPGDVDRKAMLRFVTKEGAIGLGVCQLSHEGGLRFVVAHILDGRPREMDQQFAQRLKVEEKLQPQRADQVPNDEAMRPRLRIRHLWMTPEDLPTHPLALLAYDCVVLHPQMLAAARERQLDALAQWVDAGGCLLLLGSPQTILAKSEVVVPFLRRLTRDDPHEAETFSSNDEERMRAWLGAPHWFRTGCGRVVSFPSAEAVTDGAMPEMMRHLLGGKVEGAARQNDYYNGGWMLSQMAPQVLLPDAPRPIRIRSIVWMMVAFIAVAALGDYLFLGWLRRRKYTWILFPLLAAGATAGMLAYAHQHMNSFEQRGTLRVVDLGCDGRVLRESRFIAVLPAQSREGWIEGEQALLSNPSWSGVSRGNEYQVYSSWSSRRRIPYYAGANGFSEGEPSRGGSSPSMQIEGNLSGASRMLVNYQQWTPCFFQSFSVGAKVDDSGLRWNTWQPTTATAVMPDVPVLDPSGRYTFILCGKRTGVPLDSGTLEQLAALISNPELWHVQDDGLSGVSSGTFPPRFSAPDSSTVLLCALRKDGPNLTCYRKLQRIAPATTSTP
jgi:hypothetical protein